MAASQQHVIQLYIMNLKMRKIPLTSLKVKMPSEINSVFIEEIGGIKQALKVMTKNSTNPILLFVNGGPGAPIINLSHKFIIKLNEKCTIMLISHDLGFISTYVNRVACVNRRLVCNPTEKITGDVIEACYSGPVHMLKHSCEL